MLQSFIPQLGMTFFICLFILMMQFIFRYINDLVGKGLGLDVLGELFFYAALSFVPMALPLAILLASLMTFGNLGEHFELTALKSSGISLIRVMMPLIVFVAAIATGAFFFQNNVLPQTQVKMWTLLFSARQKSLSLEITEGAINSQIPGYNVLVKHKDRNTDMLYDMLIYDVSSGANYPRIVSADSGRLSMTQDRQHIVLKLYSGNWYEELNQNGNSFGSEMYRREAYHDKEILIPYDATFTRMDDNTMRSQYVGKNIKQLTHTIDSIQMKVDSVATSIGNEFKAMPVCGVPSVRMVFENNRQHAEPVKPVELKKPVDVDALFQSMSSGEKHTFITFALNSANTAMQDAQFRTFVAADDAMTMRRHQIELQRKFTLSIACLIFFFIGAPLGAIIRKGGLGTPVVISVMLFIIYYIIDNFGYKLARDGHWPVWQGIWLSSVILFPLGVFLTTKAVNDSAVFNADAYRNFLRRILGLHQSRKLQMKEIVINEVSTIEAVEQLKQLKTLCTGFLNSHARRQSYLQYLMYGYNKAELNVLRDQLERVVDYLSNSRDQQVLNKAMDFPIIRHLAFYQLTASPKLGIALAVLFPLGLFLYIIGVRRQSNLKQDIITTVGICDQLIAMC